MALLRIRPTGGGGLNLVLSQHLISLEDKTINQKLAKAFISGQSHPVAFDSSQ